MVSTGALFIFILTLGILDEETLQNVLRDTPAEARARLEHLREEGDLDGLTSATEELLNQLFEGERQKPLKIGRRFSKNAEHPSWASSV